VCDFWAWSGIEDSEAQASPGSSQYRLSPWSSPALHVVLNYGESKCMRMGAADGDKGKDIDSAIRYACQRMMDCKAVIMLDDHVTRCACAGNFQG
jgi:hypothetical protein